MDLDDLRDSWDDARESEWFRKGLPLLAVVAVIAVAQFVWRGHVRAQAPPDRSADFSDIAPFTEVHVMEVETLASVSASWAASHSPEQTQQVCQALAARLGVDAQQTVTIVKPDGDSVAVCTGS